MGELLLTTVASSPARVRQVLADYAELTKPKVQSLLLLTTVATMEVAGSPSAGRVALTCLGGYLAAGGAGAVNHCYDRDIDAVMARTASRPIVAGRVSPRASLALAGFVGYVVVYTVWLKRRTPRNIVIGGAAGAIPPLVGWAATRGSLSWTAAYLFAIVFYWTPPHFWALSLLMKDDYARAGVPMLPVVRGERDTARAAARRRALQLHLFALLYLAALFGAMVIDVKA